MSNMAAPTAETEIVSGRVIGIIQKGADKWQVAVQPPNSQYSRNLWTKDQALVGQLTQMIGTEQSFMCGISHWTNNQGQQVRSLWINGVGPQVIDSQPGGGSVYNPGYAAQPQNQWGNQPDQMQTVGQVMQQQQPTLTPPPQQMQPSVQQQPQVQQATPDAREGKIHRQTASKVAVGLMEYLPAEVPRTYDTFLTLCQRLVAYYDFGQAPSAPPPAQDDGSQGGYNEFPPGY